MKTVYQDVAVYHRRRRRSLATSEGHDLVGAEIDVAPAAHRLDQRSAPVLTVLGHGHPDGLAFDLEVDDRARYQAQPLTDLNPGW